MACGCENQQQTQSQTYTGPIDCNYTVDQIRSWKEKFICVADDYSSFNMTRSEYNRYLGVLYSIANFPNNPCLFKGELDKISQIIIYIVNSGIC